MNREGIIFPLPVDREQWDPYNEKECLTKTNQRPLGRCEIDETYISTK